ncbi:ash family protein [Salmonella enterica subsp. enterica]|nr:ash family protein [Salmonella enterica subsp. enterica]EDY2803217.1 ash family protein [Salmonella enterica subsp. enterica]
MITYKNRLLQTVVVGYISAAPHKTGAGILNPQDTKAHNRASGFFTCVITSHPCIMAGRTGPLSGGPVSFVPGVENPVRLATLEILNSGGEFLYQNKGASSWPIANNAALTRIVSTRKPKSIVVCSAQNNWRIACISSPSATTVSWCNCACRQCSVIWQTTCRSFKNWRERRENNPPENLTQKQHSASWWGVRLSDIQEALSP